MNNDKLKELHSKLDTLVLYRITPDSPIRIILDELCEESCDISRISDATRQILSNHYNSGLYDISPWDGTVLRLLVECENPYSLSLEKAYENNTGFLRKQAIYEASVYMPLLSVEFTEAVNSIKDLHLITDIDDSAVNPSGYYGKAMAKALKELVIRLKGATTPEEFIDDGLARFYESFGVGTIGLHKAFRLDDNGHIEPICAIADVRLEDLVGLQKQKEELLLNTGAFVAKRPANNCLLYGEAGTGKSSSIKAITNRFYPDGLRVIEIYKHQFIHLNRLISEIKNRRYRFVLYMDDLSFEDFETEYKYLKAVIEGGLEEKPENILIYATSNRRHLVRESFSDKCDADDLHKNDTVQEKLSLYHRFGVTIYFGAPEKKEFDEIVCSLAKRSGLNMDEKELLMAANSWELYHGGRSGRTARQFIDNLLGTEVD